ncbi:hypothetical protein NAL32_20480 [Chryseobacterium sp. Ch-15]|uniref:Uncharacterized protein n=1 Tax=Chryseobacterium muglaense TaxID=2893752 RepID=A0A9Q3YTI3_9FLAO|nr:hypothetical protein [Chryseobacterium muglaense]MBD3907099.1 hypothetical protein [Chryseobacterium muglaense]MCC9036548.1 hypothetical protein [Chryseobacterium muglaense]MCM2556772.1 hypothetical protein [Chryseobacterium muglaense]
MKNLFLICILSSCSMNKNKTMEKKYFKFHTQYNQFYIEDVNDEKKNTDSDSFWNEKAFDGRLALESGVLGIGTQSYGNIKGDIEILEKPNLNINFNNYDHIVEGGINIQSGKLQILNCPDNHLELSLKIASGKYRVRVYSSNLASVKETDLANETDNDYYHIEIWPSEEMERKILKQYEGER